MDIITSIICIVQALIAGAFAGTFIAVNQQNKELKNKIKELRDKIKELSYGRIKE